MVGETGFEPEIPAPSTHGFLRVSRDREALVNRFCVRVQCDLGIDPFAPRSRPSAFREPHSIAAGASLSVSGMHGSADENQIPNAAHLDSFCMVMYCACLGPCRRTCFEPPPIAHGLFPRDGILLCNLPAMGSGDPSAIRDLPETSTRNGAQCFLGHSTADHRFGCRRATLEPGASDASAGGDHLAGASWRAAVSRGVGETYPGHILVRRANLRGCHRGRSDAGMGGKRAGSEGPVDASRIASLAGRTRLRTQSACG